MENSNLPIRSLMSNVTKEEDAHARDLVDRLRKHKDTCLKFGGLSAKVRMIAMILTGVQPKHIMGSLNDPTEWIEDIIRIAVDNGFPEEYREKIANFNWNTFKSPLSVQELNAISKYLSDGYFNKLKLCISDYIDNKVIIDMMKQLTENEAYFNSVLKVIYALDIVSSRLENNYGNQENEFFHESTYKVGNETRSLGFGLRSNVVMAIIKAIITSGQNNLIGNRNIGSIGINQD